MERELLPSPPPGRWCRAVEWAEAGHLQQAAASGSPQVSLLCNEQASTTRGGDTHSERILAWIWIRAQGTHQIIISVHDAREAQHEKWMSRKKVLS